MANTRRRKKGLEHLAELRKENQANKANHNRIRKMVRSMKKMDLSSMPEVAPEVFDGEVIEATPSEPVVEEIN